MPVLQFKGKSAVESYHLVVPHHTIEFDKDLSLSGEPSLDDNLIIEGDNLLALKALLPTHGGKIKCVYIDPPYNTGNEGWVYNDNLTQPQFKEWIGQVVGKEGEDLCRHDKWCCMMYPRLSLLREMLSHDGAIFISIDDNEISNLLFLCDEIFGPENRLGVIIVKNNPRGRRLGTELAVQHEYLVAYTRDSSQFRAGKIPLTEEQLAEYNEFAQDGRRFRPLGLRKRGALSRREDRPNLHYPIYVNTKDGSIHLEEQKGLVRVVPMLSDGTEGVWRWGKPKVSLESENLFGRQVRRRETGEREWDIFEIDYLEDSDGRLFPSIWSGPEFNNEAGTDQVKEVLGKGAFNYPKPVDLIKHVILLADVQDGLILDSFAGSGTTAQAIMELNHSDSQNRRFVLVQARQDSNGEVAENENICRDITAKRARRVSQSYQEFPNGHATSFSYARLGEPLFDRFHGFKEGAEPPFEELARYIFYTETSSAFDPKQIDEKTGFIGKHGRTSYYLLYNANREEDLPLTRGWLEATMKADPGQNVVYAERLLVRPRDLTEFNAKARQVPFNLR